MKVKDLKRKEMHCDCEDCKENVECKCCETLGVVTVTYEGGEEEDYIYFGETFYDGKKYLVAASQSDEETELIVVQKGTQKNEGIRYLDVTEQALKGQILEIFQKEYDSERENDFLAVSTGDDEGFGFEVFGEVEYQGEEYMIVTELEFFFFEVDQNTDEIVDVVFEPDLEKQIFKAYIEE